MKKMMMILPFMSILYIESIFGMDNLSNAPSSPTEEINWDEYIKQKPEINDLHEDYKMIAYDQTHYFNENEFQKENCDDENLITETEKDLNETNELKRKHKSNKILVCELCENKSIKYMKNKMNEKDLCNACYQYEDKHGHLIPPDKRKIHQNILVCQFCQQESTQYTKSKMNGKSLCNACYQYERRHGLLIHKGKKRAILGCEFCQKKSKKYVTSKFSGKLLCKNCYTYESRHGHLIPQDERNKHVKHKDILVCQSCQNESTEYRKSKMSGKSLCFTCYQYERRHGKLVPQDERRVKKNKDQILGCEFCHKKSKQYVTSKFSRKLICKNCYHYECKHGHLIPQDQRKCKHKNILVCEICQNESKHYVTSKLTGKSLCQSCYSYESRHGHERKKHEIHKNNNNQLNRLIDTELSQNEIEGKIQEKIINSTHFTKKQNEDTPIRYDDD